jgi:Zn-dependent peptidase ImmA (M78 family)
VINRPELFRVAAKKALRLRKDAGYALAEPCDVYQLIHNRHMELQFFDVPTLEGMYLEDLLTRRICVSAFRPGGRQRFTAAHELGHSTLLHGTKVDTIEELRKVTHDSDLDEQLAETFAAALMMSNSAVYAGFLLRSFDPNKPSPPQVYQVATWLGVGYSTLSNHLLYSMDAISVGQHKDLLRTEPKRIKSELVRQSTVNDVFQLDHLWSGERIHAQIGDFFTGVAVASGEILIQEQSSLFVAKAVGQTTVSLSSGGAVKVSVSKQHYVGFYDYRYLPEEN